MRVKLNQNIKYKNKVFNKDSVIDVETDDNNTPLVKFWRRRLEDARIDGNVEILNSTLESHNSQTENKKNKKNKK